MGFNISEEMKKIEEERKALQYVDYIGEGIHITAFDDRSITPEMERMMFMNSYARDEIYPKLNNESLLNAAKYYQSQSVPPRDPCATYDEALIHKIVPELIKRLEEDIK